MLEIVLTREDANTEFALLAEWLVEDRAQVELGQAVVVVETTKATVEVEAPGAGTIVQLYDEGVEVELGKTIARIAENAEELAELERDASAEEAPAPKPSATERKATKKALALAERHGVDIAEIDKRGFITEKDVEELIARQKAAAAPAGPGRYWPASRPRASRFLPRSSWTTRPAGSTRAISSRCARTRMPSAGSRPTRRSPRFASTARESATGSCSARARSLSPRRSCSTTVSSSAPERPFAARRSSRSAPRRQFGPNLELLCRRAFVGSNVWGGRSVRFGGGGHRDPWAVLAVGDLAFVGDEAFVNVCRPVLIGREVFLTMRSLIVTHNVGHSVVEGFENRFAPVVLEDRSQIGLGVIVYAGCRVGAEAIVASGSYVTGDIPAGAFAIGVPAKATGSSSHKPSRARQVEIARRIVAELRELLVLRGHDVTSTDDGFAVDGSRSSSSRRSTTPSRPAVVLTLEHGGADPPEDVAVLDLLARGSTARRTPSCRTPYASSAANGVSVSSQDLGAIGAV